MANCSISTPEEFRRLFVPTDMERFAGTAGNLGAELELWTIKQGMSPNPDGPFYIEGMIPNGGTLLQPEWFVSNAATLITESTKQAAQTASQILFSEFSNCQLEINSLPFAGTDKLLGDLQKKLSVARRIANQFNNDLVAIGLAPDGIPQITNPRDERYLAFANALPKHVQNVMFRVAALHFHVAAETEEALFRIYNQLVRMLPRLRLISDLCQGHRIRRFETSLYSATQPIELRGWDDAFDYYRMLDKLHDPKAHWCWVRLSAAREAKNGEPIKPMTVEFRLPDATTDLHAISRIAEAVKDCTP